MNHLMFRGLRMAALVWSVIGLTFITAHAQVVSGGFSTSVRNTDGQPVAGATVTVAPATGWPSVLRTEVEKPPDTT